MDDLAEREESNTKNAVKIELRVGKWIWLHIGAQSCDLTELRSLLLPVLITMLLLLLIIAAFALPII